MIEIVLYKFVYVEDHFSENEKTNNSVIQFIVKCSHMGSRDRTKNRQTFQHFKSSIPS